MPALGKEAMPRGRRPRDWWARAGAVLALAFSIYTFYYQSCRPAEITAYTSQYIYVRGGPRLIGVPAVFTNRGSRAAPIETGELILRTSEAEPPIPFKLIWYSNATEGLRETSGGNQKFESLPLDVYHYSPLLVLPSQTSFRVFWFDAQYRDFKFEDRTYTGIIQFYKWVAIRPGTSESSKELLCSASFSFKLTGSSLKAVSDMPDQSVPVETQPFP